MKTKIESILFISNKPLALKWLANFLNRDGRKWKREEVEKAIDELKENYNIESSGIRLIQSGDEVQMVREAVRNPIGSKRLSQIAKPGDTVAIVTDDHARPVVVWKILPAVLEELQAAGVRDEDITIIMGCGTHRHCTP